MSSKLRIALMGIGAAFIAAASFGATYLYIRADEKSEELKQLSGAECRRFYQQESLPNWALVEVGDAWMKDGSIVVEMEAKEHPSSNSYLRRLCVVDRQKGSIMIPSIRNESRWEK